MREISVEIETWPIAGAFTISRGSKTQAEVVVVTIKVDGVIGRGVCVPYGRYGETVKDVGASIKKIVRALADGLTRNELHPVMTRGYARNAHQPAQPGRGARRGRVGKDEEGMVAAGNS